MFHTSQKEKRTDISLVSVQVFDANSESINTSFWKLILSVVPDVKTNFQTQSLQQSIFRCQAKSVETRSCDYEEKEQTKKSNTLIPLFNSYWHPAYVSTDSGWNQYEWVTGVFL